MGARICPHCGTPVQGDERFCRACGAYLNATSTGEPTGEHPQGGTQTGPQRTTSGEAQTLTSDPPLTRWSLPPATGASNLSGLPELPLLPGEPGFDAITPAVGVARPTDGQPAAPHTPAAPATLPSPPPLPSSLGGPPAAQRGAYVPGYPPPPYGWYPQPYYFPPPKPPRPKGETYALVVAWITIVLGVLAALLGLAILGLFALGYTLALPKDLGLDLVNTLIGIGGAFLLGGIVAIYLGVTRAVRQPSRRFQLPSVILLLVLTVVAIGGGVVLWQRETYPGPTLLYAPLALLAGWLPALTVLAFASGRLRDPSTRRHVWLSLFYGAVGAITLAAIFEFILTLVLAAVLANLGYAVGPGTTNVNQPPQTVSDLVAHLLLLSVMAPVVEEGLKPLGAVLIMRRLRTPGEAFLVGLAGGIGFDMVETITYIGTAQADWVTVAIERVGAGLLHGVGAGMAALAWYYLINGRGVKGRWWRVLGGFLYAVLQHGIFNGSTLLPSLPGPLQQTIYLGALPIEGGSLLFFVYFALILLVLVYATGRLRRADTSLAALAAKGGAQ